MNRKELAAALAKKTDTSNAAADRTIAAFIETISDTLKKGDKVALIGFGTFEVRKRVARIGRNPKTGAALKIKASRVPAFKAGATLKATINGAKKQGLQIFEHKSLVELNFSFMLWKKYQYHATFSG